MKRRKYTNVRVDNEVYVDSQSAYHFKVWFDIWGKRVYGLWHYTLGCGWDDLPGAPDYLTNETEEKIWNVLRRPDVVFHEYDRDHNKRYTNLRYHDEMTHRFTVIAVGLSVAKDRPPYMSRLFPETVFPLGNDPIWGAPVWVPKQISCRSCGRKFSEYPDKTLAYFRDPIAIVFGYCHDCEVTAVCLLNGKHEIVEVYSEHTWALREWPLYHAAF